MDRHDRVEARALTAADEDLLVIELFEVAVDRQLPGFGPLGLDDVDDEEEEVPEEVPLLPEVEPLVVEPLEPVLLDDVPEVLLVLDEPEVELLVVPAPLLVVPLLAVPEPLAEAAVLELPAPLDVPVPVPLPFSVLSVVPEPVAVLAAVPVACEPVAVPVAAGSPVRPAPESLRSGPVRLVPPVGISLVRALAWRLAVSVAVPVAGSETPARSAIDAGDVGSGVATGVARLAATAGATVWTARA